MGSKSVNPVTKHIVAEIESQMIQASDDANNNPLKTGNLTRKELEPIPLM